MTLINTFKNVILKKYDFIKKMIFIYFYEFIFKEINYNKYSKHHFRNKINFI